KRRALLQTMDTEKFKMGWLVVAFDLPVGTKKQRKTAHDFREWLKDDGYRMIQWSVYVRPCVSFARQETHIDRLKRTTPPEGSVPRHLCHARTMGTLVHHPRLCGD